MPEKEYLPFKTINVFIERNYLDKVIKELLEGVNTLSREEQIEFANFFRKHIKILGFRNPVRAPLSLKSTPMLLPLKKRMTSFHTR